MANRMLRKSSSIICSAKTILMISVVVATTTCFGVCSGNKNLVETALDILRASGMEGNLMRIAPSVGMYRITQYDSFEYS